MRGTVVVALLLLGAGCQKKTPEVQRPGAGDAAVAADAAPSRIDAGVVDADTAGTNAEDASIADVTDERAAAAKSSAPAWVVKDNKVRCIQAPCMSLDAMPVSSSDPTVRISDVDLSALGLSAKQQQTLMSQLYGKRGLHVAGEIVDEPAKSGRGGMARVLKVVRVVSPQR